jgi:hypothetical protein
MIANQAIRTKSNLFVLAALGLLLAPLGCVGSPSTSRPQQDTARRSIFERSERELQKAAAKVSYRGEQTKPIPNVIFSTEGYKVSNEDFLPLQKNIPYNNDVGGAMRFAVTPEEFHKILEAVHPLALKAETLEDPEFLAFVVICPARAGVEGYQVQIDRQFGKEFYQKLLSGLDPKNKEGHKIIGWQKAWVTGGSID